MTQANIEYLESKLVQHVLNNPDDVGHWLSILADVIEIRVTVSNMGISGDVVGDISQEDYTNLILWFEQLKQQWPEYSISEPEDKGFYSEAGLNEVVFNVTVAYSVRKLYEVYMPEGTTREDIEDNLESLIADDSKSKEVDYWEGAETIELDEEEEDA